VGRGSDVVWRRDVVGYFLHCRLVIVILYALYTTRYLMIPV
jgi:hypothetical protein